MHTSKKVGKFRISFPSLGGKKLEELKKTALKVIHFRLTIILRLSPFKNTTSEQKSKASEDVYPKELLLSSDKLLKFFGKKN